MNRELNESQHTGAASCTYTLASTVRPIELRVRKSHFETGYFTVVAVPDGVYNLELEHEFGRRVCENDRMGHDGECDDGGPGSLYAICPLGSTAIVVHDE